MERYKSCTYYTIDSEHTIDSDIGVTGDEMVPVEKPEEDMSKSSDNIEGEEAMFAAVHNYLTCELEERYPQDLQQGAEEKWLFYLYELGLHYTSSPCCLHCADNCILLNSNCILLL